MITGTDLSFECSTAFNWTGKSVKYHVCCCGSSHCVKHLGAKEEEEEEEHLEPDMVEGHVFCLKWCPKDSWFHLVILWGFEGVKVSIWTLRLVQLLCVFVLMSSHWKIWVKYSVWKQVLMHSLGLVKHCILHKSLNVFIDERHWRITPLQYLNIVTSFIWISCCLGCQQLFLGLA